MHIFGLNHLLEESQCDRICRNLVSGSWETMRPLVPVLRETLLRLQDSALLQALAQVMSSVKHHRKRLMRTSGCAVSSVGLKQSRFRGVSNLTVYLYFFWFNGCRVEIRAGRSSHTV